MATITILEARDVPLGGTRAMTVRRTLPQRSRSLIGPWCFIDHYGPDPVATIGGMDVAPHPHTGLQTVSWLFEGEIEHRDSVGSLAAVKPGEVNLMTAGSGIAHSEVSTAATSVLHGAQLWLALPDAHRHTAPAFENFVPPVATYGAATLRVFLGSLSGSASPVRTFSPLVGAQVDVAAHATVTLPVDSRFEHGVLVDTGAVEVDGVAVARGELAFAASGPEGLTFTTGDAPVRLLLVGGEPFGESIIMWWNFIGRTHEEIVRFRDEWQADVVGGGRDDGRFGRVRGYGERVIPAPEMPTIRLKSRG